MDEDGRLTWDVPQGKWTIFRIGHTLDGRQNDPARAAGRGLECDKLSKEAAEAHFAGLMGKLIADVGPLVGKSLVATHIDSWENGSQNWTPKFREEFQTPPRLRSDAVLPVMTGRVVENREVSERFLWDLRQTINELMLENYAGQFREMAHRHGLRLTIEAYATAPATNWPTAAGPTSRWASSGRGGQTTGTVHAAREMASAAHVYGKQIVGAEAFTADRRGEVAGPSGQHQGSRRLGLLRGDQPLCFPPLCHAAVARTAAGHVDGPVGAALRAHARPGGKCRRRGTSIWPAASICLRQGLFVADVCYLAAEARRRAFGQKASSTHPARRSAPGSGQATTSMSARPKSC